MRFGALFCQNDFPMQSPSCVVGGLESEKRDELFFRFSTVFRAPQGSGQGKAQTRFPGSIDGFWEELCSKCDGAICKINLRERFNGGDLELRITGCVGKLGG